jgi:hypothetical protein
MRRKREIVENLLESLSIMASFSDPPDVVAGQFANWFNSASEILEGAGMSDELSLWQQALKEIRFSDDQSLLIAMSITKSTLLAILNKLELANVVDAPCLEDIDIINSRKMSELYIILHCYENSVRHFIEKVLLSEYGDSWWEQVASSKQKNKLNERQKVEDEKKWISPRSGASPLYYLDWGDLIGLIRKEQNLFIPYIGSLTFVENRFGELETLRNIVAHNGVLPSEDDFQRVVISFRDWCRQIEGQIK